MEQTIKKEKLDQIHKAILSCRKCRLHLSRTIAVPGQGPVRPAIMFLGEAPGKAEDLSGLPFVGRSGIFFNNLLSSFGIDRQKVYITSAVKCRPPDNRTPLDDELLICKKNWLDKQIFLVNPKLIVMLGKVPLKQIFNRTDNLDSLHGQLLEQNGSHFLVTFHPAAAMRFAKVEKKMKEDFEILKRLV